MLLRVGLSFSRGGRICQKPSFALQRHAGVTVQPERIEVRGGSYRRYFGLAMLMFLAGILLAALAVTLSMRSLRWVAASVFIAAACIPLMIQLRVGYGLDRSWVARYARTSQPVAYWGSILLGLVLVAGWGYVAILFARS